VEEDPEDWWRAVCEATRQVLAAEPMARERVAGLAVSAQAPTVLPLSDAGTPLRPAMIWMDRRAEAEVKRLNKILGEGTIYRVTGNRPDAFYVAPKLLWLKTHEPQILARTRQFVQVSGYINYRLTGDFSLDSAHAALLQLRHYSKGEWYEPLFEACGVRPEQFPEVKAGHCLHGEVSAEAAEATGLRAGTRVMAGTVDSAAAALEAGAVEPGVGVEMTGTSSVLIMPNESGVTEAAFIAMPHAIPGIHLLMGAMVASGASLRWFRDQLGEVEVHTAARLKADAFDLLTEQAAGISPGSRGVIFLPYMAGERSPLWHTNARGVFFGLSLSTPKAALIRAILEGTAFALYHNVEVAGQAGIRLSEIRTVGGGARSALWNQIKADLLGIPVGLPEAGVGAPFGDAVLAGMGLAFYPDVRRALRDMVRVTTRFEPNMENHSRYQNIYRVYRKLYEHLRNDFDEMAALQEGG
jgi:xylulokinase